MALEIRIVDVASDADTKELQEALYAYNRAATGYDDGRSLSCFLRDDDGRMIAGVDGFTWGGYAFVDLLWVDESRRGQGVGRALMEAAEAEARARGCVTMTVDTHSFQAPWLYERLGFTVVGETVDTPVGHRQLFLQKDLR